MSNKRYYWLKLNEDFFSSKRIKKLRKLAGGDTFTIIYLKMQLLSLKKGGYLYYTGLEENFAEELALDIDEDVDNVSVTLSYLLKCGLIESSDDIEFSIPFVKANLGSETASAQRSREYRSKQKVLQCNNNETSLQQKSNVDIDIDIEKDIKDIKDIKVKKNGYDLTEIRSCIDYLNEVCGTHYRYTDKNIGLIKARMKEGFTVDDVKSVINKKFADWNKDSKMCKYLRPETLFGTKFDGYLNEKGVDNGRLPRRNEESVSDEHLANIRKGTSDDDYVSNLFK